ncbi:hypothetical protein MTR_2g094150 [Medicago truncatula]|uniref:Uncharacterized protein n=1 Tax=Medicago truncatula TaxID=3880 RepID=G7IRR2_MEDTR|nr:hypothetical protein MTR_2g094150 [Medicago truncatula]
MMGGERILHSKKQPYYVHLFGSYGETYNYFIHPVNSQIYWEPTPYDKPVPPKVRRDAGRPKKNRIKDGNEEPVCRSNMKNTYNDTQCDMYELFVHNLRGCVKQSVSISARIYGMRGPDISTERSKQTLMRGPAPAHPTAPGLIRVSYPGYGPYGSTQPQFMEFIPTPGFPKK